MTVTKIENGYIRWPNFWAVIAGLATLFFGFGTFLYNVQNNSTSSQLTYINKRIDELQQQNTYMINRVNYLLEKTK